MPWWVCGEQECVEALIVFHWVYLMSIVYISLPQAHVHLTCLFVFLLSFLFIFLSLLFPTLVVFLFGLFDLWLVFRLSVKITTLCLAIDVLIQLLNLFII